MPDITPETPTTNITVAGESFIVPQPYFAGSVLNANEASALNQTYAENLRNNFASKVKEAQEAGSFDLSLFQARMDEYASEYEFGVRTGGGRSGDAVMVEAMKIARESVRAAIVKQGKYKLSDVPASRISEIAKSALARNDAKAQEIMALARTRVEALKEIADFELDSLEVAEEEPPAKKAKAAAE